MTGERETFGTRFGMLMTMIGVAVGLGNVWRFPYMTGRYGGATFVLIYVAAGLLIGVPALMAEWALGRETRRGAAGAYERVGFPLGKRAMQEGDLVEASAFRGIVSRSVGPYLQRVVAGIDYVPL